MRRKEFHAPGSEDAPDPALQSRSAQALSRDRCPLQSQVRQPRLGPVLAARSVRAPEVLGPVRELRRAPALVSAQAQLAAVSVLAPELASAWESVAAALELEPGLAREPPLRAADATRLPLQQVRELLLAEALASPLAREPPVPGSALEPVALVPELERGPESASARELPRAQVPRLALPLVPEPLDAEPKALESPGPVRLLPLELALLPVHHLVTARAPWPPPVLRRLSPIKAFHVAA
jgi:hypothetical protein